MGVKGAIIHTVSPRTLLVDFANAFNSGESEFRTHIPSLIEACYLLGSHSLFSRAIPWARLAPSNPRKCPSMHGICTLPQRPPCNYRKRRSKNWPTGCPVGPHFNARKYIYPTKDSYKRATNGLLGIDGTILAQSCSRGSG